MASTGFVGLRGRLGSTLAVAFLAAIVSGLVALRSPSSTAAAPVCPATAGGLALTRTPSRFEVAVQTTGNEKYIVCPYPAPNDQLSQTRLSVRWYETPAPPDYACGLPDASGSAGLPYRYRYSQSKAALIYVQGNAQILDSLFIDALPMLAAAEEVASGCPRTGGPSAPPAPPQPAITAPTVALEPTTAITPVLTVVVAPDPLVEDLIGLLEKGYGTPEQLFQDALNCARSSKCLGTVSDAEIAAKKAQAREALKRIASQQGSNEVVDTNFEQGLATLTALKRADGSPAFPALRAATPLIALQAVNRNLAGDEAAKAEAEAELRKTLEQILLMELENR